MTADQSQQLKAADPPATSARKPRIRWRLTPRLTDWSLALGVGLAVLTGVIGLDSGRPELAFVFAAHGIAGLWLLLLLWGKLRRVWPRIIHVRSWNLRAAPGLLSVGIVGLVIGSGVWWVAGGDVALAGFNLMNWHILLGAALALLVLLHMWARAKRLRARDVHGRRQALQFSALALAAVAIWPAQQLSERVMALPGALRRFTGSREAASFAGNTFPTSSWVADQPRPLDLATWRLSIGGAVARPQALSYTDLLALADGQEGECARSDPRLYGRLLQHATLAWRAHRHAARSRQAASASAVGSRRLRHRLSLEPATRRG